MCGICGKLYFDFHHPVEARSIRKMCQAIRHRGPDDTGLYVNGGIGLGSTRLSIIDLEGGHMPLSNEDGSIWIAYNGEVYNFPELRERLIRAGHHFSTRSDTETIVHLYEEEGDDFPKYLNGMFALAIWDVRRRRLLLARDPLGIKPLVYARLNDRFLFCSEIKGLLAEGMERELDRVALHDYLSLNYIPGPRTAFAAARKLLPGHVLTISPGRGEPRIRRYWDYPSSNEREASPKTQPVLEGILHDLLRSAVRDTMISDVPVGAFLSGGIDSSLVVALMSEISPRPVKTFSIGFNERSYSELPHAKLVAERFHTDHHELVLEARPEDLVGAMADSFDEPFADNSAVAVFAVSQLAAKDVKVVLSGDGGDEVFGGYYTYQADKIAAAYRHLPGWLNRHLLPGLAEMLPTSFKKASFDFKLKRFVNGAALPPLAAHFAWKAYLDESEKFKLYNLESLNGTRDLLRPTLSLLEGYYSQYRSTDELNRLIFIDNKVQLVDDMLAKVDRMSMAHSIEVRVPLLDQRLVSFMAQLPSSYKVRGLTLKYLLKRIAARVLPASILQRPKAGFTIPVAHWITTELRGLVSDHLSPSRTGDQGIFDPKAVSAMLNAHLSGKRDYSRSIWTLLIFDLWFDRYLKASDVLSRNPADDELGAAPVSGYSGPVGAGETSYVSSAENAGAKVP